MLEGAEFEATDDQTVVLTLQERAADVLDIMAGQSEFPAIMPKDVVEGAGWITYAGDEDDPNVQAADQLSSNCS